MLYLFFVGSTRIDEISDIFKCFENFVSQALGVLTRIYDAELRFKSILTNTDSPQKVWVFWILE